MTYKLFIDDERFPVGDDWTIVRSSSAAIEHVKQHGLPTHIAFDHDLGADDTTRQFIHWLVDELVDERLKLPKHFTFSVHSQNPIGAKWISGIMTDLIREFSE